MSCTRLVWWKCKKGHELDIQDEKFLQGDVTAVEDLKRGKASRRWEGYCKWCDTFISKQWSQRRNRINHFCSKSCAQKYRIRHLSDETRKKMSIAQKNAAIKYKLERIKSRGQSESTLQRIRKEKGLTQKELATSIGISQGYLSELENGKQSISKRIAVKVASTFEVELALFGKKVK